MRATAISTPSPRRAVPRRASPTTRAPRRSTTGRRATGCSSTRPGSPGTGSTSSSRSTRRAGCTRSCPCPTGRREVISEDGEWLAYTPVTRDERTWKRYVGGWATDVWLFNLETYESRQITTWEGTDTQPYFFGRRCTTSPTRARSTAGTCGRTTCGRRSASSSPPSRISTSRRTRSGRAPTATGEIVSRTGAGCTCSTCRTTASRRWMCGSRAIGGRCAPIARGVLGEHHVARALALGQARADGGAGRPVVRAREQGRDAPPVRTGAKTADRDAHWSPDGKRIAFLSDASGEYEVHVMPADRSEAPATAHRAWREVQVHHRLVA